MAHKNSYAHLVHQYVEGPGNTEALSNGLFHLAPVLFMGHTVDFLDMLSNCGITGNLLGQFKTLLQGSFYKVF